MARVFTLHSVPLAWMCPDRKLGGPSLAAASSGAGLIPVDLALSP